MHYSDGLQITALSLSLKDILKNMIKKKKKIGGKKRKNDDGEDIGSSRGADLVNVVKKKMAEAGERDEKMIKEGKPATKKLLLLPWVREENGYS